MPLPWARPTPLLLAPMQGLTNRALRAVVADLARPDVLFTEFVRVRPGSSTPVVASDLVEATTEVPGVPLVVQVIGSADEGVVEATADLVARGVQHVNVNMGCPWGRMTAVLAGGGMFRAPESVAPMLRELRAIVPGSLSVKTRSGIDDERELLGLLPAFAEGGIDFLVLHARTVKQKYHGDANHRLTAEVVRESPFPVIANGDIRTASDASRVLETTGAAGLMLGRGAVADPWLFARIRGELPERPEGAGRQAELGAFWARLLDGYADLFSGDAQILAKLHAVMLHAEDEDLRRWVKSLKKQKSLVKLRDALRV
ncbi:MAG: tRNA-dihydrouridine synthase family protein [Myxococcales bacterium]|nr:tRNA-dihydrouridine synthase family protein [Myxococcales bacterium]